MKTADKLGNPSLLIRGALLIVILYVFLLSIQLMGGSFKLFGTGFANTLISLTTNPFVGLFIGILATSVIQSSSATTSIVVGLTASGALTIGTAIPIIMGANIGTSITSLIVSLGHITRKAEFMKAYEVAAANNIFNVIFVAVMFPIELVFHVLERTSVFLTGMFLGTNIEAEFTNPLSIIVKPVAHAIQELLGNNPFAGLIIAILLLFITLNYFVKVVKPLAETEFKHFLHRHIFNSPSRSFAFGIILTAAVQSSSVTTSLVVPLAAVGILTVEKLFPFLLGANIGTTFTAILASLVTGSPAAMTVAFSHLFFNTFGSVTIFPFRKHIIRISTSLTKLTLRSRIYPVAYIVTLFFIFPSTLILFVR